MYEHRNGRSDRAGPSSTTRGRRASPRVVASISGPVRVAICVGMLVATPSLAAVDGRATRGRETVLAPSTTDVVSSSTRVRLAAKSKKKKKKGKSKKTKKKSSKKASEKKKPAAAPTTDPENTPESPKTPSTPPLANLTGIPLLPTGTKVAVLPLEPSGLSVDEVKPYSDRILTTMAERLSIDPAALIAHASSVEAALGDRAVVCRRDPACIRQIAEAADAAVVVVGFVVREGETLSYEVKGISRNPDVAIRTLSEKFPSSANDKFLQGLVTASLYAGAEALPSMGTGSVRFSFREENATISVDGSAPATTTQVDLAAGPHAITASADGFIAKTIVVDVVAKQSIEQEFRLVPTEETLSSHVFSAWLYRGLSVGGVIAGLVGLPVAIAPVVVAVLVTQQVSAAIQAHNAAVEAGTISGDEAVAAAAALNQQGLMANILSVVLGVSAGVIVVGGLVVAGGSGAAFFFVPSPSYYDE